MKHIPSFRHEKYLGLDQPFTGAAVEEGREEDEGVGHVHENTKKRKLSRRTTVAEYEAAMRDKASEDEEFSEVEINAKKGISDCRARIEDYYECLDAIMLKVRFISAEL